MENEPVSLDYLSTFTSNQLTQQIKDVTDKINDVPFKFTGPIENIIENDLPPNKVVVTNELGKIVHSSATIHELKHLKTTSEPIRNKIINISNLIDESFSNFSSNIDVISNEFIQYLQSGQGVSQSVVNDYTNYQSYAANFLNGLVDNIVIENDNGIKLIVNDRYEGDLDVKGEIVVDGNMVVKGTTSELESSTGVFRTDTFQITTDDTIDNPPIYVNQIGNSNILDVFYNNDQKIAVTKEGYVGIGKTNPEYFIDVASNINITGKYKINGNNLSLSDFADAPSEFPPESHIHNISNVTGLSAALAGKQDMIPGMVVSESVSEIQINADIKLTPGHNLKINDTVINSSSEHQTDTWKTIGDADTGVEIKVDSFFGSVTQIDDYTYYYAFTTPSAVNTITFTKDTVCDVLVVGGGGSGGNTDGGGGGAGGLVFVPNKTFIAGEYKINVGAGGVASSLESAVGTNGEETTIKDSTNTNIILQALGGGGGGFGFKRDDTIEAAGTAGGSGGGAPSVSAYPYNIGATGTQKTLAAIGDSRTYGFGNNGGNGDSTESGGGGGGGAGEEGFSFSSVEGTPLAGTGGKGISGVEITPGVYTSAYDFKTLFGLPTDNTDGGEYVSAEDKIYFAGGGGCGHYISKNSGDKAGGLGGGGTGASSSYGLAGLANTGGGGGGGGAGFGKGGDGGSGIVIIKWRVFPQEHVTNNDISVYNDNIVVGKTEFYDNFVEYGNMDGVTDMIVNTSNSLIVSSGDIITQDGSIKTTHGHVETGNLNIKEDLNIKTSIRDYSSNVLTKYPRDHKFYTDTSDMYVWYKFNEDFNDSSGNGNDATDFNAPTFDSSLNIEGTHSVSFTGGTKDSTTSSYLTVPSTNFSLWDGFTVSCWVMFENDAYYGKIIDFGDGADSNNIYISRHNTSNNIVVSIRGVGIDKVWHYFEDVIINNTWMHIVFSMLKSPVTWNTYINGALKTPTTVTGTIRWPANTAYNYCYIAKSNWTGVDAYFKGKIDDFRIYNRALTPEEVRILYQPKLIEFRVEQSSDFYTDTTDMLAWYKFDGDFTDSSGNGNNLTNTNCIFNNSSIITNSQCVEFIGTSYLRQSNTIYCPSQTSICFWGYFTGNGWSQIISTQSGATGWLIQISNVNTIRIFISNNQPDVFTFGAAGFPSYNQWFHFALILNSITNIHDVYVNGVLVQTYTYTYTPVTQSLSIGTQLGTPAYYLKNGEKLDDLRIYKRALTPDEVTTIYNCSMHYRAFNNNKSLVGWVGETPTIHFDTAYPGQYLKIDLGEYILPKQLTIAPVAGADVNKQPKDFRLYGAQILQGATIYEEGTLRQPTNIPGTNDWYYAFTSTSGTNSITFHENTECDVLVVGGGGGGGNYNAGGNYEKGGGGAGAYEYVENVTFEGTYNITVGAGGAISGKGGDTKIIKDGTELYTCEGGGSGGGIDGIGGSGGSGGGGNWYYDGGNANNQLKGNNGAPGTRNGGKNQGGGGGGAGSAGNLNNGGDGLPNSITGTLTYYAGGGGGNGNDGTAGTGGLGGGGRGSSLSLVALAGEDGKGGGGGGGYYVGSKAGGKGGSGIVIIRWTVTNSDKYMLLLDHQTTESMAPSTERTYPLVPDEPIEPIACRYFTLVVQSTYAESPITTDTKISEMELYGYEQRPFNLTKFPRYPMDANSFDYPDGSGITVRCTGSSEFGGSDESFYSSFRNFPDTTNKGWASNSTYDTGTGIATLQKVTGYDGEFIMIDLGEQIILNNIKIYPRLDLNATYRTPKEFKIFASNSSTSFEYGNENNGWTDIYTGSANGDGSQTTPYSYIILQQTSYRYYMLVCNKNFGANRVQFYELEFWGHLQEYTTDISNKSWKVSQSTSGNDLVFSTSHDNGNSLIPRSAISASGDGSYTNFTGIHHCKAEKEELYDDKYIGMIVSSTNKYQKLNSVYDKANIQRNIDKSEWDCLPIVTLTSKENDKDVFGVITKIEDVDAPQREIQTGFITHYYDKEKFDRRLHIAGVGEGGIWVCDCNGNIESGDYISSSSIGGFGMKQSDDIQHNYTVAKATMNCDFNPKILPVKVIATSNIVIDTIMKSDISSNISTSSSNIIVSDKEPIFFERICLKDNTGKYIYEELLDDNGEIVYEPEYEMKYINSDNTFIDISEYSSNIEGCHKVAFIGCSYHCS